MLHHSAAGGTSTRSMRSSRSRLRKDNENHFSWMDRGCQGPEYVSYSQLSELPSCSFDFGNDGYAASSNYGGELLQMTAPSDNHGMVFARGDFEYSLYLALARGQKEKGGKSAFGLRVATPDQLGGGRGRPVFQPCCMTERGCFNYRWPFNEYCLHVNHPSSGTDTPRNPSYCFCPTDCGHAREGRSKVISNPIGSYSVLSFIKEGVLYQVLRLSPRLPVGIVAERPMLVLTVEPPMRLQSFRHLQEEDSQRYQVGLRACTNRTHTRNGEACVSQSLPMTTRDDTRAPRSEMHWQAKLFKIEEGDQEPTVIKLEAAKEKKDHVFKINDGFDSLPSFQAKLELAVNTSHVFVATFRLFEQGRPVPLVPPVDLSHDMISEFVRKGEREAPGTAAMWQTIFDNRQDRLEWVPELCEGSIIGRCLEKILRVDLVPATIWQHPPLLPLSHFTVVSNMFLKATVELKSLFWKVRFLVKVDKMLSKRVRDSGGSLAKGFQTQQEYDQPTMESKSSTSFYKGSDANISTAEATVKRIRYVIGETVAYIVEALVKPTFCPPVLLPELRLGDPGHFYAMITLLYVLQNYPKARWPWQNASSRTRGIKQEDEDGGRDAVVASDTDVNYDELGVLGERLPSRKENVTYYGTYPTTRVKFSLLEWLHHEAVFTLQTNHQSSQVIPVQWRVSEQQVKELRYLAKSELVKRVASAESYRSDDEIADRLVFLAWEMWSPTNETVKQVTSRVVKRVSDRQFTHEIDLCRSSRVKEGTDDGPWELHALCHHSRLVVASMRLCSSRASERREVEKEVEHFRKKLHPFLTSEASLTPCWERNNLAARRGFLRSEATAVLASTLMDIFLQDVEFYRDQSPDQQSTPSVRPRTPSITINEGGSSTLISRSRSPSPASNSQGHNGDRRKRSISPMPDLRRTGGESVRAGRSPDRQHVNYLKFRPPRKYHPVEFFNSLDDTPELYSNDAIAERQLSFPVGIRKALRRQDLPVEDKARKAEGHSVESQRAFRELRTDMSANADTTNRLRELLVGRVGKIPPLRVPGSAKWQLGASEASRLLFESEMTIIDLKTPDSQVSTGRPSPVRYKEILGVISDSLVDQEVCHRFLLARAAYELPPGLLRLFVHVLHPEMIECFNNHHHRIPRFGLSIRQETMVIHITLRSWSLRQQHSEAVTSPPTRHFGRTPTDIALKVAALVRRWTPRPNKWDHDTATHREQHDPETNGDEDKAYQESKIYIPSNLSRVLAGRKPTVMELKVSSIGMSTNEFGDFSKCSIITDLLELDEIEQLGQRAQKIWDGFTHQPQTGRFLAFSLVLGILTQGIVRHYNLIIDDFLKQTQLEKQMPSYLGDPERLQQRDADAELRLSLWSLEALNKLSDTVSISVRTISEAMAEITVEVSKQPSGRRSPELEAACRNHMQVLERSFSDLTAIQTRLARKVELSTRYSSALSAVLALRASRDSYTQNNTIQKLTYLTIGCLPIGLTAAVFAVPKEQLVIPEGTGKEWFIGAVVISFVVIFCVAYFLDSLLRFLRWCVDFCLGRRGRGRQRRDRKKKDSTLGDTDLRDSSLTGVSAV